MKTILIIIIKGYQKIVSPLFPPSCRFYPSCSEYGIEAVTKYGTIKGGIMTAWRILRCNPLNKGGYDPVR
jgi:uncharacterized protein